MDAFHSNWTRPFFQKYGAILYEPEDFELLTSIVSALKWREKNGSIKMVTDEAGATFYRRYQLDGVWDGGIETVLDEIPHGLHPKMFWAAGKLYALQHQTAPVVMIDTDFIIWEHIQNELRKGDVTIIHRESLHPDVYPPASYFQTDAAYIFPKEWDWSEEACNTALAYFSTELFRASYVREAIQFMNHCERTEEPLTYMVFAEQRLLAMQTRAQGGVIHELMPLSRLYSTQNQMYTHVWGYKETLRKNKDERIVFCERLVQRIQRDFPTYIDVMKQIPLLMPYIKA